MHFHMYAWGNAYYATSKCISPGTTTWDRTAAHCWRDLCDVSSPPDECWEGTPLCQHGAKECEANQVEACAIKTYKKPLKHMPFVNCVEINGPGSYETCATEAGLDWQKISQCVTSLEGNKITQHMAKKTVELGTSRPGTPWLLINGTPVQSGMLKAVCDAYTGPKPSGCSAAEADEVASAPVDMCEV